MLKNPESAYTPGKRGQNWLKRKPDVETLDLVVTGAEWGEGRRANLLGTFELSVRTPAGFEPVGNVATGITDEQLADLHELLEPHVSSESGTEVDIEPAVVFGGGLRGDTAFADVRVGVRAPVPPVRRRPVGQERRGRGRIERLERLAGS